MGRDMYVYSSKEKLVSPVPECIPEDAVTLHYWRKNHQLHAWMERLFREKGGEGEFNMRPVVLTGDDLKRLEAVLKTEAAPDCDRATLREAISNLEFLRKTSEALKQGLTVLYDSSW